MMHIINILVASLSLGLFCMGVNFYINLHLGYDFLSMVIALEVASALMVVAVRKNVDKLNINTYAFLTLWSLMASGYLLIVINFTTVTSYVIALICVIAPIVLTGVFMIHNRVAIPTKTMMLSVLGGLFMAVFISYLIMERQGIWMVFMLSSAAMILAIVLRTDISSLVKISVLFLFVAVLLLVKSTGVNNQLANWSLFDKPVTKHSLNILYDYDKNGLTLEKTIWEKSGRVDIVSNSRSRNEGSFWAIYNANITVPYADKSHSTVSWWNKHYPLMVLPLELIKPSKVLTVAAIRGGGADISKRLYGADTMSIYNDCVLLDDTVPCNNTALNVKLKKALNPSEHYDLVLFSIFNQVATPYVGATASQEAIYTIEIFNKLFNSLNKGGLLAINSRDPIMLHKMLSYVWRVLSDNDDEKIINFENNIRVLKLNKYNLKNDAYNYIVLVSKDGFTPEVLDKINNFVRISPVTKVIYDSANNIPPYIFFKQLNRLTVSAAVSHLTMASSWQFKKLLNLEPSSIIQPDFFHLAKELHPFISALSVIFLCLGLYGLIFSHNSMRVLDAVKYQGAPALSILLLQALLSAAAFVLLLYVMVNFTSASLGYSLSYVSLLILLMLTVFVIPSLFSSVTGSISRNIGGLWFYPAILLLCVFVLILLTQTIDMLLGTWAQIAAFVLAMMVAFSSGQVHHQAALLTQRLYPGVWFWFWCMTSVGTVLGLVLAKYILIGYDLNIMVDTAMAMFIFMTFIAWWSLTILQKNQR